MRDRLVSRLHSRPFSSAVLILCGLAVALFVAAQAVAWGEWARFAASASAASAVGALEAAQVPGVSATLDRLAGAPVRAIAPYVYRGKTYHVTVEIPAAELRLARSLSTERVFASHGVLRSAYLRAMVDASHDDPVVSATCSQLRQTRDRLGLDTDEYAELLIRFVQQIPYGPIRSRFGSPAVVLADGHAVCADKSVLLAALLEHEGFGAAVVAIDASNHAAAALKGTGPGFLHSGYAYVETTTDSYVGEVPACGAGVAPAGERTQIVSVGSGRAYTADVESEFIGEDLMRAERAVRVLAPYGSYAQSATGDSKQAFAAMAQRHLEAVRLFARLVHTSDYRERTYALMTRSGGR